MELTSILTYKTEVVIANELRSLYSMAVIEETIVDQSDFLSSIISLVDENNMLLVEYQTQEAAHSLAYRLTTNHELATAFLEKYHNTIDKACSFAYSINSRYGYSIDIASVAGPFFLYQCGVTDENVTFYLTLGLTISNIICNIMANKHGEKLEQYKNEEVETICKSVLHLLNTSKKKTQMKKKQDPQLDKCIRELDKIVKDSKRQ